jgi:hypothetical protein
VLTREYILSEIKRTASAHGGMALGLRRFLQETGIRSADWERYWVRWSDALRDAGCQPNEMATAYTDAELFERLIGLMRMLGHFPGFRELRMKSRADKTFPNDRTFQTRLGSKQDIASKLMGFCNAHEGHDDIIVMCAAVAVEAPQDGDEGDTIGTEFGFVYLMKSGRYYKLGRTNSFGRREREIALQLPDKATTVHTIRTDDPVGIEAYWHKRFEPSRRNGEWFELTKEDVGAFKRRKFM